jgi:hypothetical protein
VGSGVCLAPRGPSLAAPRFGLVRSARTEQDICEAVQGGGNEDGIVEGAGGTDGPVGSDKCEGIIAELAQQGAGGVVDMDDNPAGLLGLIVHGGAGLGLGDEGWQELAEGVVVGALTEVPGGRDLLGQFSDGGRLGGETHAVQHGGGQASSTR